MINLNDYNLIVINSSAGKDSQAMLDYVVEQADAQGFPRSKIVVAHADLGRVEWKGTKELAEKQAECYGIKFWSMARPQGDLLEYVEQRGMWPSPEQRWCTSDLKRAQIMKLFTELTTQFHSTCQQNLVNKPKCRILNCMGMRAQESPARSKLKVFENNKLASNKTKRTVDTWLPIHSWTVDQVWERIQKSGVPHHPAYDLGMPRLSCVFCIYAPVSALMIAGKHNPELLDQYVAVEERIGHSFKNGWKIAEIKAALERGDQIAPVTDWKM